MTRVKVCGITNQYDAEAAVAAGADALGFVFAESPRRVSLDAASEIIRSVPLFVASVGVFVNEPVDAVRRAMTEAGLCAAQLHGDETEADIVALGPARVIRGFRVASHEQLDALRGCTAHIALVEPWVPGKLGGPGVTLDRDLARAAVEAHPNVMLAGGLSPENVYDIVHQLRPFGVDVSGGVEAEPGRKDHYKLNDFLAAVRAADAEEQS